MIWHNKNRPFNKKQYSPDWSILVLTIILGLFGLLVIADASAIVAQIDFGDQFYYLKRQAIWLFIGLILMIIMTLSHYQKFKRWGILLLLISLVSLIAVLIPGLGTKRLGAQRWLKLGPLSFQPSELVKLALVVWGAGFFGYLPNQRKTKNVTINEKITSQKPHLKPFWPFLFILLFIAILIVLEPDLGTTIVVIATGFCLCFLAKIPSWKMLLLLLFGSGIVLTLIITSPYRRDRLITFINPSQDPQGISYHSQQILIALGSGGLLGQGIGQGKQKYAYLPEVVTDSIFAVVAEELGFIGAVALIALLALLVFRCLKLAFIAPDLFGQLICAGIGMLIAIQTLINLGSIVGIFPLTGIPLPLISYGGSSLIITLTGLGMVLSVSRCRIRERKSNRQQSAKK
jgi:cell division protein FtsW